MDWPEEEITKQLKSGRTFNSYQNPAIRARIEANMSAIAPATVQTAITSNLTITPQRRTPEPTQSSLMPPPPPPHGLTTKALTDLSKLYNSETIKFGGEMYDILDAKLKIFCEMCRMVNIQPYNYHEAFPLMLKGRAHQFYYDHLAERNFSFDDMIQRTKNFFHTVENQQLYLQEWRSTTLHNVIAQHPDKNLSQNLEFLIDKLQKIQRGLSTDYCYKYALPRFYGST